MDRESTQQSSINSEELPSEYDRLVSVDKLVHGEHNPRRVRPKDTLRRSICKHGIHRPLIVRPADHHDIYYVTDGWQRYQAATDCGWERLPVRMYNSALEALNATEVESVVREWSTYEWAQYCQSLADELQNENSRPVTQIIAERTIRAPQTIRRYLDVLSLPTEIHPILNDGPAGTDQQWAALQHYNKGVRRYEGLSWRVAARLARRQADLDRSRIVGIAAKAVEFDAPDDALEFIEQATDATEMPLETVRKHVLFGSHHTQYLEVPHVAVPLAETEKRAIMEYCHQTRQSLSDIVETKVESLAAEVTDN